MAAEGDCLRFVSLSSVQNLITNVWNGQIINETGSIFAIKVKPFLLIS